MVVVDNEGEIMGPLLPTTRRVDDGAKAWLPWGSRENKRRDVPSMNDTILAEYMNEEEEIK